MRTSDLEDDIKRLLAASNRGHDEFDGKQRQLSCRVSVVCHYQIGVLAEKLDMTRTALAERLLEQATAIAWNAAGLGELSDADIQAIKGTTKTSETQTAKNEEGNTMKIDNEEFSRINCIRVVFRHLGLDVGRAKDSKAVAVSSDNSTQICCLTSKDYALEMAIPDGEQYWFTIYEQQLDDISRAEQSYAVFGCGSLKQIIVVPTDEFCEWSAALPPYTQGKKGWHVRVRKESGRWELRREGRGTPPIEVSQFVI